MERYPETDEVNLVDLMFYCLKRWRWIVVWMILIAGTVGIYKYQATIIDNQLKREEKLKQTEQEETESEPIMFEDPASSAVSFAIIGMIGGVCLVCLVFCMSYIMGGKLQSENNFEKRFGMPLLGVIRKKEKRKGWFGFVDRKIRQLEEGPYSKISRKEQIKIAVLNVQAAISENSEEKIEKVMIAGSSEGSELIELCTQLENEIDDVTFSKYSQIIFHAEELKRLKHYEGILFIEKKGESYEKLVRQEKKTAMDRGIKILGVILC